MLDLVHPLNQVATLIMSLTVNVHEAKTHFSRLLEQAHAGQEIILAKAGKPYARLMPLSPRETGRQPGRLNGRLSDAFFDPLPEDELAAWEDGQ
jgi:prevent-host-death family protein